MTISRDSETFKHWTPDAVNCFNRKMKCSGCITEQICKNRGQDVTYGMLPMKYAVLVLFARHGAPKERDYED